jgi:hypothetical protein
MNIEQKRGMSGNLKPFDRNDHTLYDSKGKQAFIKYLDGFLPQHLRTIENPNEHGIDLLTINKNTNKVVQTWEIEVRYGNWRDDTPFPFNEINCIERKDHQWRKSNEYLKKIPHPIEDDHQVCYVQLNAPCTRAVLIDSAIILDYPLKPWANRKGDGEYVRQVPVAKTIQIKIA